MEWWRAYEGIPWREGGASVAGCDCWGLVGLCLRTRFGVAVPALGAYSHGERSTLAERRAEALTRWPVASIAPADAAPGDVWLAEMPDGSPHAGLVVEPGLPLRILHVTRALGRSRVQPVDRVIHRRSTARIWRWAPAL